MDKKLEETSRWYYSRLAKLSKQSGQSRVYSNTDGLIRKKLFTCFIFKQHFPRRFKTDNCDLSPWSMNLTYEFILKKKLKGDRDHLLRSRPSNKKKQPRRSKKSGSISGRAQQFYEFGSMAETAAFVGKFGVCMSWHFRFRKSKPFLFIFEF